MKIAVLNVKNNKRKVAMNKDLNGGFGTADSYADTLPEKIIGITKKRNINIPILSLAFLMGTFKKRNIHACYFEEKLPKIPFDIILIYGSIVDYKNENAVCSKLKSKFKNAKVGFIGPFPSIMPRLFDSGDFVIIGDFEYYFLNQFSEASQLNKRVLVDGRINMDDLPSP